MRISYRPLFSVECRHTYFADGVCKALALCPAPQEWERLRQRYQLLFRPSPGGGAVYYEQTESNVRRLYAEATPIAFTLASTDPLFDIYTEGGAGGDASPGETSETVHYFSNRDPSDVFGQPTRLLLHPPDEPFARPPLPVRSSSFTQRFEEPVRSAEIKVLDAAGRHAWETETPASDVRAWPIDLRGQPCGCYRLIVDGTVVLDFYLSDAPAAKLWGVVEIAAKDAGQQGPLTFTIALAPRKTVWRYYIFDRPREGSPDVDFEVIGVRKPSGGGDGSGNGNIQFTRRPDTVPVNGRPAFVFESDRPIPLSEVPAEYDYLLTFKANGGSRRSGESIKLPFAQPGATKLDAAPGGAPIMYSESFVYL